LGKIGPDAVETMPALVEASKTPPKLSNRVPPTR
jgi:hypothetical protein